MPAANVKLLFISTRNLLLQISIFFYGTKKWRKQATVFYICHGSKQKKWLERMKLRWERNYKVQDRNEFPFILFSSRTFFSFFQFQTNINSNWNEMKGNSCFLINSKWNWRPSLFQRVMKVFSWKHVLTKISLIWKKELDIKKSSTYGQEWSIFSLKFFYCKLFISYPCLHPFLPLPSPHFENTTIFHQRWWCK